MEGGRQGGEAEGGGWSIDGTSATAQNPLPKSHAHKEI